MEVDGIGILMLVLALVAALALYGYADGKGWIGTAGLT